MSSHPILLPLALLGLAGAASAQQTLVLTSGSGSDDVLLLLGPGAGEVRVEGVDNVADGALFFGVTEIQLATNAGSDKVTVLGSLAGDMRFAFDTGADSDQVFFQFSTPSSAELVRAVVRVEGGAGGDQVVHEIVSAAPTFLLDTKATTGEGADQLVVKLDAQANTVRRLGVLVDGALGAEADVIDVEVKSSARTSLFRVSDEVSAEDETVSIVWDQTPRPGLVRANFGLRSGSASVDMLGQGSIFDLAGAIVGSERDDAITVRTAGRTFATDLAIEGALGNDSIELLIGLDLTGDPLLSGGLGDDMLKLIVERDQFLQLGLPTIDGGPGIDVCDAPGVIATVISCEE